MDGFYPLKPHHINTNQRFYDGFKTYEANTSARWLALLAQKHGDWRDFTREEIDELAEEAFHFNGLTSDAITGFSLIRDNKDGTYSFTHQFIALCFMSSPVTVNFK